MAKHRILLIMSGGIAAYKCLDLVRRLDEREIRVTTVMTAAAQRFVTPLSIGALTHERVLTDLFDLDAERDIGHIRLSREVDLIVVAPATADLMARMAGGRADDLATAVLLATDKPVLLAPAMNPRMWSHPATRRNAALLEGDGIRFVGPNRGEMAERGEAGEGRMAEPAEILTAIEGMLLTAPRTSQRHSIALPAPPGREGGAGAGPLSGRHVLITSGPTHEPIDPVRYIANRSSGKQGHAIAQAAAQLGARVTLVSGPVTIADPPGVATVHVETADDMLKAVEQALPADIGIFAAAVADWRVADAAVDKVKKTASGPPTLSLVENPDILRAVSSLRTRRPRLVIGFAAETRDVVEYARKKRKSKGADWIVANDVSPGTGIMGGDRNTVYIVSPGDVESWPEMTKAQVAERLMLRAAGELGRLEAAE